MSRLRCCGLLLISCLGWQSSCWFFPFSLAKANVESHQQLLAFYSSNFHSSYWSMPFGYATQTPRFDKLLHISDTSIKACPNDVETLISLMIEDLPNYANRVIQRSRRLDGAADESRYVVLAGNPEFEPLTLGPGQYSPKVTVGANGHSPVQEEEQPQQVFITTLERQYIGVKALDSQSFHWLFLTQTTDGWRLAMMFTQIGSSSPENPPMPPQESSNWIIGQAVSLWLRDCRAKAIRAS